MRDSVSSVIWVQSVIWIVKMAVLALMAVIGVGVSSWLTFKDRSEPIVCRYDGFGRLGADSKKRETFICPPTGPAGQETRPEDLAR